MKRLINFLVLIMLSTTLFAQNNSISNWNLYNNVIQYSSFPTKEFGNNEDVKDWIINKSPNNYSIEVDTFTFNNSIGSNIIVTKLGKVYPDTFLLLMAHYDTKVGEIGSNDNGTGISALLEISNAIKNIDFEYSVKFVYTDGLYNSLPIGRGFRDFFNNYILVNNTQILSVLNPDGIGIGTDKVYITTPYEVSFQKYNDKFIQKLNDNGLSHTTFNNGIISDWSIFYSYAHALGVFDYSGQDDGLQYINIDYLSKVANSMLDYSIDILKPLNPLSVKEENNYMSNIPNPINGELVLDYPVDIYDISGNYLGNFYRINLKPGIYILKDKNDFKKVVVI